MMFRTFFLTCLALPILSSCGDPFSFKLATAGLVATSHGVFSNPNVNIKEKSYAAADFLVQDLRNTVLRKQMLSEDYKRTFIMNPLVELDNASISSEFGSKVPEWLGRRFSELGYETYLHKVAPENNTALYPAPPAGMQPDLFLTGTYSVQHKHVDVMLRVFDSHTNALVANFDYAMPLNREIRNMAKTKARIFRIKNEAGHNNDVLAEPLK